MKLGIVGLPNVGKSTLFNAITRAGAEAANYPFCTIEPNVGVVTVPDERSIILRNTHPQLLNSLTSRVSSQALPKAKALATSSFQTSESAMRSFTS